MVNLIILQFAIILVVIYQVHSVSVYSWTLTGRKLCWNNATKEKTEELLNCDKLMRSERKKLLEICMKSTVSADLDPKLPMICSYSTKEKNFQVMDCMFNKTGEVYGKEYMVSATDEDFDKIDAIENEFEWCIMKAGSVYGFEHLCDIDLNDKQTKDIENCDKVAKEMVELLNECRKEAKLPVDKRPAICDFYKNTQVLDCWNKKSIKWTENVQNDKWNKYIECLDDIKK